MGVKCCRPAIRQDPKNDYLLSTIYSDIQEAGQITSFEQAIAYLSKKGHIKTLGDYLSSHLTKILPSIMTSKNKLFSVRNKNGFLQMLYCCITSEILSKIITVVKESKNKYQGRSRIIQKTDNSESESNEKEREFNFHRGNPKKVSKYEADELTLIDNEIVFHVVETCSEVVKQTLVSKKLLTVENESLEVEHFQFKIIASVQQTLYSILEKQGSFIKGNNSVTKEILDQLILIVNRCSSSIYNQNFPSSMFLSPMMKNQQNKFRKERDETKQGNKSQVFRQSYGQKKRLLKLCLSNYYKIIKKGNNYIVNSNLFQQIIKFHFSYFLDFWQNLTSQQKNTDAVQENSKDMEFLLQSIFLEYFHSFSSHRQSEFIYKQLLHLFDKLSFKNSRMFPIERLLFTTLKNYQLKQSIISKLFDYMLNYIAIIGCFSIQSPPNFSASYRVSPTMKQSNYLRQLIFDENLENYKSEFPNWFKKQNIIGCLQTLKRWVEQRSIDIGDMLKYKNSKILTSILVNFAWGSGQINKEIHQVVKALSQKNISYYLYLIQTAVTFINTVKFEDFLNQNQYDWGYFSERWRGNSQSHNIKMRKNENKNIFTSSENNFHTKGTFLEGKTNPLIQLASPINFINQIISIASYPRFFNSLMDFHKQEQIEPQVFIRRSTSYLNEDNVGSQLRSGSNRRIKKKNSQVIYKQKFEELDSIKQNNSNFHPSVVLIPQIYEELTQIMFFTTDIHRFTTNSFYRLKLISIFIAANLKQMLSTLSSIDQKYSFNLLLLYIKKLNKLFVSISSTIIYLSIYSSRFMLKKAEPMQVSEAEKEKLGIQKNSLYINTTVQTLLKCLKDWVYPSITFLLNEKLYENEGFMIEKQVNRIFEEKLYGLLAISFKIYIKKLAECSSQLLVAKFYQLTLIKEGQSDFSSQKSHSIFNFGFESSQKISEQKKKERNNISFSLFFNKEQGDISLKLLVHILQTILFFNKSSMFFMKYKKVGQVQIPDREQKVSHKNERLEQSNKMENIIQTICNILQGLQTINNNECSLQSIHSTSYQKQEEMESVERREKQKIEIILQKSISLLHNPQFYSTLFNFIDELTLSDNPLSHGGQLIVSLLMKQKKLQHTTIQNFQSYPSGCMLFQNMFSHSSQMQLGLESLNKQDEYFLTHQNDEKSSERKPDGLVIQFCQNYSQDIIPKIIGSMLQKYKNVGKWQHYVREEHIIKTKNNININQQDGLNKEDSVVNSSQLEVTVQQNSFRQVVGMMKEY